MRVPRAIFDGTAVIQGSQGNLLKHLEEPYCSEREDWFFPLIVKKDRFLHSRGKIAPCKR
jgi:hypothetical protein